MNKIMLSNDKEKIIHTYFEMCDFIKKEVFKKV